MDSYKIKELISAKISGEWGEEPSNHEDSVGVLRTTNFKNSGQIDYSNVVRRKIESKLVGSKKLKNGDVIIEKSGGSPAQPVGRVVYFNNNTENIFLSNNFTAILRPNEKVYSKYFFYLLYNNHRTKKTLKFQNKTTGILNLKLDRYLDEVVFVPSLNIQRQVSIALDKADELRRKRHQAIELLDEYVKSVFYEMFGDPVKNEKGWKEERIKELCTNIVDCPHSTPVHGMDVTYYPCIRTSELENGYINWESMKYVSKETYIERTRRLVPRKDDIIFGREGTFGEAIRVPENVKICLGQRVMLFRPDLKQVNSIFLWTLLRSDRIYQKALRKSMGSTVGHINVKDIIEFTGIVPSLLLQNKFAEIVQQVEQVKSKMHESLKEMDNLFNSLMQRAFKGGE